MAFSRLLDSHKDGGKGILQQSRVVSNNKYLRHYQEGLLLLGDIAKVAGPHEIGGKSILQQPRAVASIAAGQTLCYDALP